MHTLDRDCHLQVPKNTGLKSGMYPGGTLCTPSLTMTIAIGASHQRCKVDANGDTRRPSCRLSEPHGRASCGPLSKYDSTIYKPSRQDMLIVGKDTTHSSIPYADFRTLNSNQLRWAPYTLSHLSMALLSQKKLIFQQSQSHVFRVRFHGVLIALASVSLSSY